MKHLDELLQKGMSLNDFMVYGRFDARRHHVPDVVHFLNGMTLEDLTEQLGAYKFRLEGVRALDRVLKKNGKTFEELPFDRQGRLSWLPPDAPTQAKSLVGVDRSVISSFWVAHGQGKSPRTLTSALTRARSRA